MCELALHSLLTAAELGLESIALLTARQQMSFQPAFFLGVLQDFHLDGVAFLNQRQMAEIATVSSEEHKALAAF
ncbi:hypothetical protein SynBIOSE41_01078 [Synechococcus sp. BIOS-E4-1]|nr:hypothetical protein SynBIOSE41_01078 [Synechococcus sp. BIOS-E4-1]